MEPDRVRFGLGKRKLKVLVHDGEVLTADEAAVRAKAQEQAERDLAAVGAGEPFARKPLDTLIGRGAPLGGQCEDPVVDADVDRTRVCARKISDEHVVVVDLVQVERHETGGTCGSGR